MLLALVLQLVYFEIFLHFLHLFHCFTVTSYFLLQITTIAATVYLRMAGRPPVLPSNQLSYTENFLYMLDSLYVFMVLLGLINVFFPEGTIT